MFMSRYPVLWLGCREPVEATYGLQDERQASAATTLPADPPSLALEATGTELQAVCPECGGSFEPQRRRGPGQRFCRAKCRVNHNARLARERKGRRQTNGEDVPARKDLEPESVWERPLIGPMQDASADPAALAVPRMPWEERQQA